MMSWILGLAHLSFEEANGIQVDLNIAFAAQAPTGTMLPVLVHLPSARMK